jgi:hypothetical protein
MKVTRSDGGSNGMLFAGVMMIVIGIFQAIAWVAAIIEDDIFVVSKNYTIGSTADEPR